MNIFNTYKDQVRNVLSQLEQDGVLPEGTDTSRVTMEPPRDPSHGDMATNAAMVLSKAAGMKPRDLADAISAKLKDCAGVTEVSIAGPGFINMRLDASRWQECVQDILTAGTSYGDSDMGQGKKINVEYVSANPTGPLTAGHARGAVVGDALSRLLSKAGYDVTKEYYTNDAGAQVEKLARSTYLRYQEALGHDIPEIPAGLYPGDYLKDVGQALADRDGDKWMEAEEKDWLPACRAMALDMMMAEIKKDLQDLNVEQDVFSSEAAIIEAGAVEEAFNELVEQGLIYTGVLEPPKGKKPDDWEERPQTLFRATQFGDDVDRPLKKSDGSWTYFANDIAYHYDKYKRGADTLIDVLGADHGGYIKRLQAAVKAISGGKADVDVLVCQLVHMFDNGQPVRMSKRAGTFVTLRDVIDQVGADVLRFIMLTRKNDQTLEFDFAKVKEQSKDNPVFYVQYAHARCHSVLRNAKELFPDMNTQWPELVEADMSRLSSEDELQLIRFMAGWPRLVESAAEAHEPHRIAFYLNDMAAVFHAFWNKGKDDATLRFLHEDDESLSKARLALVRAVALVIASGLEVMGVKPLEEMHA